MTELLFSSQSLVSTLDFTLEGAFLNKGTDKKMVAVIVIPSGENILVREKEWLVHVEVPYGNQNSFYVMTDEERQDRFEEVEPETNTKDN